MADVLAPRPRFTIRQMLAAVMLVAIICSFAVSDFRGTPVTYVRASVSPDGKYVAALVVEQVRSREGGFAGCLPAAGHHVWRNVRAQVVVWDAATGELLTTLHDSRPGRLPAIRPAWSADTRRVAAVGGDGMLRAWEYPSGRPLFSRSLNDNESLGWRDSQLLVAVGSSGPHPPSDRQVRVLQSAEGGSAAFSPDGSSLAFIDGKQLVFVDSANNLGRAQHTAEDNYEEHAYDPGNRLAYLGNDRVAVQEGDGVCVYNPYTGQRVAILKLTHGRRWPRQILSDSARGDRLAIGGPSYSDYEIYELDPPAWVAIIGQPADPTLRALEFTPDGRHMLETRAGEILLRDLDSQDVVWRRTFRKMQLPWQFPAAILGFCAVLEFIRWRKRRAFTKAAAAAAG